ncbi:hypothetical protein [Dictyobacter kobayashii]|uniref:ABC transporter permease n=1 Tax=Dictyobacter kobayashii TaxID=2014872 RepID=A0A402ATE5_9CHLR|nr:hypothetical protein [Dictyobacter kobayashii]GCE22406.1 hypothetical protein KDK_62060 [Dictyobacter kobayashii]
MSSAQAQFFGICRYEFSMQLRRPSLWIFFGLLATYGYFVMGGGPSLFATTQQELATHSLIYTVVDSVASGELLLPLCVGCLLADRLVRDRRVKVDELFNTMRAPVQRRLWGKYVGSLAATLVPLLIVFSFFQGHILVASHNVLVIPLFIGAFLLVALPGILFVTAFSLACPMVMPLPLYQFLFAGYWLWGNLFLKQQVLPTLSRTILTPSGALIANGFFGVNTDLLGITPPLAAVASMIVLVSIAALVMLLLGRWLKWQQWH